MRNVVVIWLALVIHFLWGCLLVIDNSARATTPIHTMSEAFPVLYSLTAVLFIASALALWGLLHPPAGLLLVLPQQFLLLLTAFGAVQVVIEGEYADGTVRPIVFILADQLPTIVVAALHTGVLFQHYVAEVFQR